VPDRGRKRVVLLVDDNAAFLENLVEILEDAGYGVRTAGSCAEARGAAAAGYDLAIVDVRLPDGDGTALAGELKTQVPDGEVILLTGFATTESAAAAVRAGAWAYLVKPVAMPDLLLAIEQALRQIRLGEEKQELARRAQRAEKLAAVGQLAAGLSHEIRNPLNAAALQLAVLERRLKRELPDLPPTVLEPLALVQGEIRRLNQFLEEFLQFARPRELAHAQVDLQAVLQRVVDLLRAEADEQRIRIEGPPPEVPPVPGDEGRLQQALVNLVLNAIQATPPGGAVRVAAGRHNGGIRIAIEDSGPGVPAALREKIFEPFFTTKESGSGLGLPMVHAIVQQHGGSLTVEDAATGGARFVVQLPAS
jgi:two-component system, NtrC family, sensor histidine kinase HydH